MLAIIFFTRTAMGFQFQSIPSVAPFLVDEFGLSYSEVGLLTGLFMLPGMVLALPGGMLGQRFGDRVVVAAGLALMAVGAALTAASETFAMACVGRAVSGAGGILMNILLAKMVADWFAGRELATAMGVMLTSWPVGIGLAVATLGEVATLYSWRATVQATTVFSVVALLAMLLLYRNPPRAADARPAAPAPGFRLAFRDLKLAASIGLAWSFFNASLIVFVSFAPSFLIARGTSIGEAGALVSLTIWTTIVSVPLGGWVADRARKPDALIVGGSLLTAVFIMFVPIAPAAGLWCVLIGFALGFPPGAIMSLLPQALRPEILATGLGYYYTAYYLGMAASQPLAGFVRDLSGDAATPIFFAGFMMAATVHALTAFRQVEGDHAAARRRPVTF